MSDLSSMTVLFTKLHREFNDLPETSRRLTNLAAQAGPEDRAVLDSILSTLNVQPGLADAVERGKALGDTVRAKAERYAADLVNLAASAHLRAEYLRAQAEAKPEAVPVIDFGPGGVRVMTHLDQAEAKRHAVYGLRSRLPESHVLKTSLPEAECPTVEGKPVIYLGRPVASLSGVLIPAPSYPVAQAVAWTQEAGRRQKEQNEREEWDRKEAERQAKEAVRRPLTMDQLTEALANALEPIRVLEAAETKNKEPVA